VKVEKADTDNGGTDNGGTGNGGTDNNGGKGGTVDNGSGSGGSGSSNTGGNLPSTSTNMFNYMTAGLVSLFIALALWLAQRKRRKSVVQ
jgi:LPXTG-motif cell wall-anchored protein